MNIQFHKYEGAGMILLSSIIEAYFLTILIKNLYKACAIESWVLVLMDLSLLKKLQTYGTRGLCGFYIVAEYSGTQLGASSQKPFLFCRFSSSFFIFIYILFY